MLTYSELQNRAKNIAFQLNRCFCGKRNQPVMVFLDKGCDCLAAMFGVLYSGNFYVPMDIKTPKERFESIATTLESRRVIFSDATEKTLDGLNFKGDALRFDDLCENVNRDERDIVLERIRTSIIDTELMYVLFTSGSTGVPKGVAIAHRAVVDYIESFLAAVPFEHCDVVGNQVPFYADMSLKDIYMTIAVGATVIIIPQTYFMTPKRLLAYMDENDVTMIMWVPTAYGIISRLDALSRIRPRKLNKLLFSGEAMPMSVYHYWSGYYPDATWIQQYGPTEITGACTSFQLERKYDVDEAIPIGKPFHNTGILLLADDGSIVNPDMVGVAGEICVYGTCLAEGYYNNPQKTAESFTSNPLFSAVPSRMYHTGDLAKWDQDGNLVFLSRNDYQIKHGGRRVELGEIEAAVDKIDAVKSACCVHDPDRDVIALFYVGEITAEEITERIKNDLPKYMIPSEYYKAEILPQLPNGKLDRKQMQKTVQEAHHEKI